MNELELELQGCERENARLRRERNEVTDELIATKRHVRELLTEHARLQGYVEHLERSLYETGVA